MRFCYIISLIMILNITHSFGEFPHKILDSIDELKYFNLLSERDTIDLVVRYVDTQTLPQKFYDLNIHSIQFMDIETERVEYFLNHITHKNCLKELILDWVNVNNLIGTLKNFDQLEDFEITRSKLDSLKHLFFLKKLKNLLIVRSNIDLSQISTFENLEKLTLDGCYITISDKYEIFNIESLYDLNVIQCGLIDTIPDNIMNLRKLVRLKLADEPLVKVSHNISNLNNLKILYISGAPKLNYDNLLQDLSHLSNSLAALYLLDNSIRKLPQSIFSLVNLEELGLSNNHLSALGNQFDKLPKLNGLFLKNNDLSSLPESIKSLTKLDYLDLSFNNIKNLRYFKTMSQKNLIIELDGNCADKSRIEINNQ